ncbi:diacylglycerol lipase, beta [Elysia marginata]|uniref:sn-1-specific diacylglycerol lipase n=1 Tax=Elysia marginata TaxID=1093978 RepID=A0AAV4H8X4_9GAST|nr:diacylglycerol lipase, beta [Elysia marginata]
MPSLQFLGRKWGISSDDFVFSSIAELLLQVTWIGALATSFIIYQDKIEGCDEENHKKNFYFGTLVLDIADFAITSAILCISMRGSIKSMWPRRHIAWCLTIKLIVYIAGVVWICLSSYWVFFQLSFCGQTLKWIVRGALLWSWLIRVLKLYGAIVIFSPPYWPNVSDEPINLGMVYAKLAVYGHKVVELFWEKRASKIFSCFLDTGDHHDTFKDVGSIAADYFDVDLVQSDVVAGLVLLLNEQVRKDAGTTTTSNRMYNRWSRANTNESSSSQPSEWMTLSNLAYYMRYAIACYGSCVYVAKNPFSGPCRICCRSRCCTGQRPNAVNVGYDDCWQSNMEAIKNWTNLKDEHIIYYSLYNQSDETPFFVTVDPHKNAVVIAVRGNWSSEDGFADFGGRGSRIHVPNMDNTYCHPVMVERALDVQEKLTNMEILQVAFNRLNNGEAKLVITGHSLGSGVASILAILLKQEYPNLVCYAFSPMRCSVSPNLAHYTENFICSATLGSDMIARTNTYTLTQLKLDVMRALMETDMPKYQILATGWLRFLCCWCTLGKSRTSRQSLLAAARGQRYNGEDDTQSMQVYHRLEESLHRVETDLADVGREHWPLVMPGTILHLVREDNRRGCCSDQPLYRAIWKYNNSFDEIRMSSSMLSDHLPGNILHALEHVVAHGVRPTQYE